MPGPPPAIAVKTFAPDEPRLVSVSDVGEVPVDLNGNTLSYQGDITAPPEQIINCRCVCFYDAGPNVRIGPDGERIPCTPPNPGDAIENPEIE